MKVFEVFPFINTRFEKKKGTVSLIYSDPPCSPLKGVFAENVTVYRLTEKN